MATSFKVSAIIIVLLIIGVAIFITIKKTPPPATPETPENISENGQPTSQPVSPSEPGSPETPAQTQATTQSSIKNPSRAVFAIKDKAMGLENIKSILITFNSISLHSPQKGWITLSNTPKTFDLIALKTSGKLEPMLDTTIEADTYTQMRLAVGAVVVIKEGIARTAKVPSGEIKIPFTFTTEKNKTSAVVIDIRADSSLHSAHDDTIIFAPVLHINTRTQVKSTQQIGKYIDILGGASEFDASFGMDEDGATKINYTLDPSAVIQFAKNVFVIIPKNILDIPAFALAIPAEQAIDTALEGKYISSVISVHATLKNNIFAWRVKGLQNGKTTFVYIQGSTGTVIAVE